MSANHNPRHNKSGRHNKQNNRHRNQNGRGRKGGGRKQHSQQPLTTNRQIDSNGPAGKLRGNVKQLYDKYKALAHENRTKDRITSEAHGQYAHHYYVLYSEISAAEAAQEVEREKEKEKQKAENAENQSNVVPISNEAQGDENVTDVSSNSPEEGKEKAEKPKRKPRARKKTVKEEDKNSKTEAMPELPLDTTDEEVKVERPKKRTRSAKKDVAE